MKTKHIVLSGLGVFVLWIFFWPSEKDHLNAQMAELCKKDGGVKVYETVKLPAEMFDDLGNLKAGVNVRKGEQYVTQFAGAYELVTVPRMVLKDGDPLKGEGRLARHHSKLERISDGRLLAEVVNYYRSGGDRWFAGMPSSSTCRLNADFLHQVFKKK
ncbi:MAG: hypothetical protein Q7V02_09210 [Methylophilus sp.]|nr:hypothetical protein [Methylophilus sp.]